MASWTDKTPTFNPYVQQLPVEAMVKVGMQKQQQYDEGVKKIQASIDNVAGLDVMRGVDKNYLQSKLNALGDDLTFVAAGDFSDFQLTNSVNGMTKQIVGDPNVQNAVSSAAWYRKQAAEMEKSIADGKSSQSNIYDFNEKASRWLNSNKLEDSFRDRYTPYTDVKKKAMDTIKALHPDLQKYDIPFKVDANGKMDARFYADAMKRYKIEGVSETKIAEALAATMTPDDLNQLRIDSKYEFRGAGPEQLAQKAKQDYDVHRQQAIGELDKLQVQKAITTDPTKLNDIENEIDQYKELLGVDGKVGKLDENFYNNVKQARTNPDEVKYNIYKDGFVKEFANAFKWSSKEEEAVTNPYKEQENWVATMKLNQAKFQQDKYEFGVNTQFKQTELGLKKQEIQLKAEENAMKKAELYGVDAPWTDLGNPTDNENRGAELFSNHVTSVDNAIKSDRSTLVAGGYTEQEINGMLSSWKNAQGVPSKANIPADAINSVMNIAKNQNYINQLHRFETKTRADSEKEAGVEEVINAATKGRGNISFSTKAGERITLTPREMVGINNAIKTQTVPSGELTTEQSYVDEKSLNQNQRRFVREAMSHLSKTDNATRETIRGFLTSFKPAANKVKEAYSKADEIYMQKLGKSANAFVPRIKAVANSKGEVPPIAMKGLSALIIAEQEQGLKTDSNWDFETASSYVTDEKLMKNTNVLVKQDGDSYEIEIRNSANPSEPQRLKVSGAQVAGYLGDKYVNTNAQASARVAIGRGNTDITKGNVAQEAVMQKQFGDFPGIQHLQVTANLKQDRSNPDLYIPTVFVKNKQGKYTSFELSGSNKLSRVGYEQGVQNLNALNDQVLLTALKQAYPKFDFSTLDY
jgi:hypothetical protein